MPQPQLSAPLVLLCSLLALSSACDDGTTTSTSNVVEDTGSSATDTAESMDTDSADTGLPPSDTAPADTTPPDTTIDTTMMVSCQDDAIGGDTPAMATPIESSTDWGQVNVCAGGEDWYRLSVIPGDRLGAALTADDGTAPPPGTTLRLYDGVGEQALMLATDGGDRLLLTWLSELEGDVLIRVAPPEGVDLTYSLSLLVERTERPPDPCTDAFGEPNESRNEATVIASPERWMVETRICEEDTDWYAFMLEPGEVLTINMRFLHGDGDLDMGLYDATGQDPLLTSTSAADEERIQIGPVQTAQTVYLEVYGWQGATNTYTLATTLFGEPDGTGRETGQVRYEDRPYDTSGLLEAVELPMRSGLVEIVRERDGAVVASGLTDDDGRFDITFGTHNGEQYRVRALAAIVVARSEEGEEAEVWRARVEDRTGARAIYALVTEPFDPNRDAVQPWLLTALADGGPAGAMNVADVLTTGFRFVQEYSDRPAPELIVRWQSGQAFSCGSCFSEDTISLGGQLEDTDEFDDHIILHEFGHYVVRWFSNDDSPGGPHRDRQVSPRLAYGEGLAYFWCAMVLDAPMIVDTFIDDVRVIDAERATQNGEDRDDLYGTTTGDLDGALREEIITAIMWDALDPFDESEPFDTLNIGIDGHMSLLFETFAPEAPVDDLGPPGIDLTDWLGALYCAFPESQEVLPALTTEREFPWDADTDTRCQNKGSADAPYRLEHRSGEIWLHARPSDITLTQAPGLVHLRRGSTRDQLQAAVTLPCGKLPCLLATQAQSTESIVVTGHKDGRWFGTSWNGPQALEWLRGSTRRHTRLSSWGPVRETLVHGHAKP
ncbi:MAG: hypothetical protein AAFX99_08860 [Myxococcota bacterium]